MNPQGTAASEQPQCPAWICIEHSDGDEWCCNRKPEAHQCIDMAIIQLEAALKIPYFEENEGHIIKAIALLQAGDHHE